MVARVSWALPSDLVSFTRPASSSPFVTEYWDCWFLRTVEGEELIGPINALRVLAEEAEGWKDGEDGYRLPEKLFVRGEHKALCTHGERFSIQAFEKVFGTHHCDLWEEETKKGMRLYEAEKREGDAGFLSKQPLVEKAPAG